MLKSFFHCCQLAHTLEATLLEQFKVENCAFQSLLNPRPPPFHQKSFASFSLP